jgi:hypothetical protein
MATRFQAGTLRSSPASVRMRAWGARGPAILFAMGPIPLSLLRLGRGVTASASEPFAVRSLALAATGSKFGGGADRWIALIKCPSASSGNFLFLRALISACIGPAVGSGLRAPAQKDSAEVVRARGRIVSSREQFQERPCAALRGRCGLPKSQCRTVPAGGRSPVFRCQAHHNIPPRRQLT